MESPRLPAGKSQAADEFSAALFDLRDALLELSLALKDLRFETDLEQREVAEGATRQLLAQIAPARGLDST